MVTTDVPRFLIEVLLLLVKFLVSNTVHFSCFVIVIMIVGYDVYCDGVAMLCRTAHAHRLGKRTVLKWINLLAPEFYI
jgi:hypothetical protein